MGKTKPKPINLDGAGKYDYDALAEYLYAKYPGVTAREALVTLVAEGAAERFVNQLVERQAGAVADQSVQL
jgi:hypothetical protein